MLLVAMLCGCASSGGVSRPLKRWIIHNGGLETGADAGRARMIALRFSAAVEPPPRICVLRSTESMAWAWPDGRIFLTSGLVRRLSDDGIAAVIAHEVGHLLRAGHANTTVALTGCSADEDEEIAADVACLDILAAAGIPPASLRDALNKVLSTQDLTSPRRPALLARIARLP